MTFADVSIGRTSSRERATCSLCGRRRMCQFIVIFGHVPGLGWMVCREHGDWEPVEGVDYEVTPS